MKKQFFRVKQLADQTFSRAEKSDVLTEDMIAAEKRVEALRHVCQNTTKKVSACLQGVGLDSVMLEKRQKKIPEIQLSQVLLEGSSFLGESSTMGRILEEGGKLQNALGKELFVYELEVEKNVLGPLQSVLEIDIPNITKLRKQLAKLTLDMDSARTRYQTANRHSQMSSSVAHNKVDSIREELEDASTKVEQCRDALASEMFSLLSREAELTQYIAHLFNLQATYHRNSLTVLENFIPNIFEQIENFQMKPMYGTSLEEHLRITNREIASVIETCICSLVECGMDEEGLFRVAGSASKVKKLKAAFDAGIVDISEYYTDPHTIAGALKSYLRELPEPLLTYELYNDWMQASGIHEPDKRLQGLWQIVQQLPEQNYNNLRYLIKFFSHLASRSEVNKMSPQNIAIVIPPNIIWAPSEDNNSIGMNMTLASTHSSIVDSLVMYADWFFPGDIEYVSSSPRSPKNFELLTVPNQESHSECAIEESSIANSTVVESPSKNEANKQPVFAATCQNVDATTKSKNNLQHDQFFDGAATVVPSNGETDFFNFNPVEVTNAAKISKPTLMHSPKVPKRQNKKAAPPIPKERPQSVFEKSSSLDRNMSVNLNRPGRHGVMIERAQSCMEKSSAKVLLSKKENSDSRPSSNQPVCHSSVPSKSEENLVPSTEKIPMLETPSSDKSSATLGSQESIDGDTSPKSEVSSPVVAEKRFSPERPTDKPPLPPEKRSDVPIQFVVKPVISVEAEETGNKHDSEKIETFRSKSPESIASGEVNLLTFDSAESTAFDSSVQACSDDGLKTPPTSSVKSDGNAESTPPERPPRTHSPSITVLSGEKQFCTVIQLQGQQEQQSHTPSTVKTKPARPQLPPPPIAAKPRANSSMPVKVNENKAEEIV